MLNVTEALEKLIKFSMREDIIEPHSHEDIRFNVWNWPQGVAMYGMMRAYEKLGDKKILDTVKKYVDYHFEQGIKRRNINYTAGYNASLDLYKIYGNDEYRTNCEIIAKHTMSKANRTNGGAFAHSVDNEIFSSKIAHQIWADTLFMGVLFIARWGHFTGDIMYLQEAARQLILHYEFLTDEKTGLVYHGYDCKNDNHMSGVLWGRANGWCIVSSIEILDLLPEYMKDERETIIENLNKHIASIVKYVDKETGMWHTAVDHPETYLESTVTACVYYGLKAGTDKGYVKGNYSEIAAKALEAVVKCVSDDGSFSMASGGTPIKNSLEEYNNIEYKKTYYAQGLAILALLSAL